MAPCRERHDNQENYSDGAPQKCALQIPAQTVYCLGGTDASQAERIVVSPDQASVSSDCGLVSDLPTRAHRPISPMGLEGRARIGEVDDGGRKFLFELVFCTQQFGSGVFFSNVREVRVSHGVRTDGVAGTCQPAHFLPRHHRPMGGDRGRPKFFS